VRLIDWLELVESRFKRLFFFAFGLNDTFIERSRVQVGALRCCLVRSETAKLIFFTKGESPVWGRRPSVGGVRRIGYCSYVLALCARDTRAIVYNMLSQPLHETPSVFFMLSKEVSLMEMKSPSNT